MGNSVKAGGGMLHVLFDKCTTTVTNYFRPDKRSKNVMILKYLVVASPVVWQGRRNKNMRLQLKIHNCLFKVSQMVCCEQAKGAYQVIRIGDICWLSDCVVVHANDCFTRCLFPH